MHGLGLGDDVERTVFVGRDGEADDPAVVRGRGDRDRQSRHRVQAAIVQPTGPCRAVRVVRYPDGRG
jgi:hypothetical protein